MLARSPSRAPAQRGTTMLEVLVTIIILAFGMLGLAGLQSKIFVAEMESYQRGQAVVLMNNMVERINANRNAADTYVGIAVGKEDDGEPADCSGAAAGLERDRCEWSNALKGAAETSGGKTVGGAIGARGCVTEIRKTDDTLGVCTPGIYLVTVAWQGLSPTSEPNVACGKDEFGDERLRRALSARVSIGLPSCQ